MTGPVILVLAVCMGVQQPTRPSAAAPQGATGRLRVFLDCPDGCFQDYLRDEIAFVDYVRDRTDADVHALVTRATTGAGGREFTFSLIGLGRFQGKDHAFTSTSARTDSEERIRRGLATALKIALLNYVARDGVPEGLAVEVDLGEAGVGAGPLRADPWKRWIFSVRGSAEFDAEESTRETQWAMSVSADRITPEWKITIGGRVDHTTERFDLDEDEPFKAIRRNRVVRWLVVRGLGEHWSVGGTAEAESSTFENRALEITLAPAVEWNFFPYSAYTRRQLRVLYFIGGQRARYYEETLFGKTEETLAGQELSATYEQREPWGTLEGRVQWSNYFPGLSRHRLEFDSEVSLRVRRGLSLSVEAFASRIRDQLSLPRRDASAEEVLLRIRRLQSGYQLSFAFGVTYQFGSIHASIVNPRFGQ